MSATYNTYVSCTTTGKDLHQCTSRNFFPFICSTSRSEGTNARFKDNVGPTRSLILFVKEYDRIMSTLNKVGNLKDKDKAQQVALLQSTYTFERQARNFYNTQIFYRFQQLVKATRRYVVDEVEKKSTLFTNLLNTQRRM
jgi:hypothetical protein